ncbi:MAG: sensor histidine kinase N-terminal domain-containing protein [Burkholderiales bacterium]|nr:sensor histidine kinase N-terminal domain-containing protein [Burkholderiales bacterium]
MRLKSLRAKLLVWTIVPLALLATLDVGLSYWRAIGLAKLVQESQLMGSARMIAEQVSYGEEGFTINIPPAALELFDSGIGATEHDQVFYRVSDPSGTLLSGYAEMAPPRLAVQPERGIFFESRMRDESIHVVAFAQPVYSAPNAPSVLIEVGQTKHARDALARLIWQQSAGDHLFILTAATVLIVVALRLALRPLLVLRDRVLQRHPGMLEPLEAGPMPSELRPLVAAINDYVNRLRGQVVEHDRFIADASHQLRTPLTVFNTQVSYALRQPDLAEKDAALTALRQGLRSSMRLVAQLLAYTEADARMLQPSALQTVDLADVIQRVLEDLALVASEKQIDLGYEGTQSPLPVQGTHHQLNILLSNLVDNALRYTPAGGMVTVRVARSAEGGIVLTVEDNGPGIAPAERDKVFDRFYRLHGEDLPGCGLGLAIVREIALSFGIALTLSDPASGTGTVVTLRFPTTPAP